jgi:hypothetical protein
MILLPYKLYPYKKKFSTKIFVKKNIITKLWFHLFKQEKVEYNNSHWKYKQTLSQRLNYVSLFQKKIEYDNSHHKKTL